MSGTFSQIYIQVVFAVKGRRCLMHKKWRKELHKYMSGIIENKGHKSIIVNGVADHVHLFIGLKPAMALSDLVRDIKNNSSKWINENNFIDGKFEWQNGYGAFSYSKGHVGNVYQYIMNQETHHAKTNFKEEYINLLDTYEIPYEERFLFEWIVDLEDGD